MNLTLTRKDYLSTGIFGEIDSDDESLFLYSLEHAYLASDDGAPVYQPKVPAGSYVCRRGTFTLKPTALNPDPKPFETFQICDVPGHTDILFHRGNTNDDSSGCVLVGLYRSGSSSIMQSRVGFKLFMDAQSGVDEFVLNII